MREGGEGSGLGSRLGRKEGVARECEILPPARPQLRRVSRVHLLRSGPLMAEQ